MIKPVFVIGTPRSGTTLTSKILGKHSHLFMPGETHFVDDIYSFREKFGDLTKRSVIDKIAYKLHDHYCRYYEHEDQIRVSRLYPTYKDLAKELYGLKSYAEIFNKFMVVQMQETGKMRWGNNVPRDIFNVKDIKQMFPYAKFIICVRDIRAFLLSYKGKWEVVEGEHYVSRMKKLYHPVVTSYLWKASMRQLTRLETVVPQQDMCIVHYEDLTTNTEETVRHICHVIDEPFEDEMLKVDSNNSSTARGNKGIFSSSIDRWKSSLSQEEISIGQYIGRDELYRLGYQAIKVQVNPFKIAFIWLKTPLAFFHGLNANKEVRGPLIPYLFKRLSALFKT